MTGIKVFTMTDFIDDNDDHIALERMTIGRFYTAYNVRRASQAPTKFDSWSSMQLPVGCIFHSLNGWDKMDAPNGGLPDPTLPPLVNEKLPIYLKVNTSVATDHSGPFGVKESYSYRPNTLTPQISHFFQTHRKFHRILSDRTLGTMSGVLTWIDYSPLHEIKVSGTLHSYRKFDIIFRTMLDLISSIGPGKAHYILLPQSDHVFARALLQRSFKDLSTGTLNGFAHDPSIYPMIHLLGYVYGKNRELNVNPYKEDVKLLGKTDPLFTSLHSTSLLERLNKDLFASLNFVIQKDDRAIVYNLGDLDKFAEDDSFYQKFYRHIMNLRLSHTKLPEGVDPDSDEFDTYVDDTTNTEPPVSDAVIASPVEDQSTTSLLTEQEVVKRSQQDVHPDKEIPINHEPLQQSFEERLRTATVDHSLPAVDAEPKKEAKRNSLMENHLKVSVAGRTLGELIQPIPLQAIAPKRMDFITSTPEESYQRSSLVAMDKAYQTHAFHHDMGKVVSSLSKHGMFITKVEEDKVHTEMDRTTTYRFHLSDLNGKTHHIKYTLPDVDDNGIMKLSGINYRLTRQIANVPICKTSPTRVNLSSYYNKIIVERVQSKRYSYEQDTARLILDLKAKGKLNAVVGQTPFPTKKVAYDYSAIGRQFTEIGFGGYTFYFGGNGASANGSGTLEEELALAGDRYGIFVGTGPNQSVLFWAPNNTITQVVAGKVKDSWASFHAMLLDVIGSDALTSTPIEWTQAKVINQVIPLVYILSYRFGLKRVLDMINLSYVFYPKIKDAVVGVDDLLVEFSDGALVFNRYPLSRSLIASGLLWADLRRLSWRDMNLPETYATVLNQKRMSVGVLKGLNGIFDFFVDPITEAVLEKMKEPITFHELLLRANVMLTDYHADESSSVKLHRFRLYERFNGIVYNEIYRALANHRGNPTTKKSFSINPEAVFQKIVQDATVSPNEVINPVHEVKQRSIFTYTGGGGRMGRSFTPKDIVYPQDGLGVISESVPDSGKVGITSYLSASPNIDDIHGLPKAHKEGEVLEPPQILSVANMVMPGGTTDDGKRANYLGIQISHYVPNHEHGETLAVRTGYDAVLPHLSTGVFATAADDNGVVESIDDKQKVLKVRYADKAATSLRPLKLPYLDTVLDGYRQSHTSFGYLIPEADIASYPMGGVFALTKSTYGKIVDRLRIENLDAIPDKEVARKQNSLIQDFNKGHTAALYYLRFQPINNSVAGEVKSYSFADVYSQNSGSYLLQKLVPNVKVGEKFKTGDILIYNQGFFVPDPLTKQVTFKHGITANIALIEKSSNHEDACEISRSLADRLKMTPSHQREVVTNNDAVILSMVKVGDHVETPDALCIISDDYLVGSSTELNIENLDIMEKLNRQTPPADYTGTISKIRILYACDRDKLSDSLKTILKVYEKEVRDNFKALSTSADIKPPEKPGWVAVGTRYQGVTFAEGTVILEFMITETLGMSEGDKLVVANACKSIVSHVAERQHYTESGIPIDMLFSSTSITNRIVASPFNVGIAERNMDALRRKIVDLYFK
jgi:hypothetical protein